MDYQFLGNTGVQVSPLCFGTMSFGGIADEATSKAMFDQCRDAGINFFDCANVYEKGTSESILGKFIKDCRNEVFITSKVYFRMNEDVNAMGATRYHIMHAVEQSLRRLKTDRIDLYFIHRFDARTPIEETLGVFNDLVRQGKVLYLGASNFAAWQVAKALGISERKSYARFECIQPMYNLVKRQAEVELFPLAQSEKLGVIPYSPLGGGLLTGKYTGDNKAIEGRLITNKMYQIRYGEHQIQESANRFALFARENGFNPVSLAVAWAGAHPAVTAPIIGARNTTQLKDSIDSLNIDMSSELYSSIANLSQTPPPATDRNEEKSNHNYGLR